ncbi:hypothetical protein [Paenibacillus silviterrae]|uniref:hypothetical protein n=1 Tax=Paenibacillus silviterrae TaxID=3242194 RepID=UPI002543EEBF|nr:hypothetical protein [Paenibacillus chinjuensis]
MKEVLWEMMSRVLTHRKARAVNWKRLQLYFIGFLAGNLLAVLGFGLPAREPLPEPMLYSYYETMAGNGVKLHAVRTSPDAVILKAISGNVTKESDYGINGGFFWQGYLLSIAVMNNFPVKGQAEDYGSGWHNIDHPKGTLVWDAAARRFSTQVVLAADELQVTDKQHYWAQGGVSMSLSDPGRWVEQARKEDMPLIEEPRLRSGAVYDAQQQLWLIVSDKPCTAEQFRTAILETIMPGRLIGGIFLDGDGSSQMKLKEVQLKGDSRPVYQMIALRST